LNERPGVLARNFPGISKDMSRHLHEDLAVLQVALDEAYLQRITLDELMKALLGFK